MLEISFGVLRSHYLAALGQQLQSASCWQAAEAALFGLRSDMPYHNFHNHYETCYKELLTCYALGMCRDFFCIAEAV